MCTASLIGCRTGALGKRNMGQQVSAVDLVGKAQSVTPHSKIFLPAWSRSHLQALASRSSDQDTFHLHWCNQTKAKTVAQAAGCTSCGGKQKNQGEEIKRKIRPKPARGRSKTSTHTHKLSKLLKSSKSESSQVPLLIPPRTLHTPLPQAERLYIPTALISSFQVSSDWKLGAEEGSGHDSAPLLPLVCLLHQAFVPQHQPC